MKPFLFTLTFVIARSVLFAQDDSTRVANLQNFGQNFERGRVIIWLAKNSLNPHRITDILDTLNLGIIKASECIGAPHPWQVFAEMPLTFFLCDDDFVPHASANGYIFMPRKRFETNKALWLHETMHILLRTKSGNWNDAPQEVTLKKMPMWLIEGLPEYIAMKLSYENNFPRYDAWKDGGYLMSDSACAEKLHNGKGSYILNFIGKSGVLTELFGKTRPMYAPTFYNCSCSFTKYLVDQFGIGVPLKAISAFGEEENIIQELTSKDLETLRRDWLVQIGFGVD